MKITKNLKIKMLTYVHEKTGRMLNNSGRTKAERAALKIERKRAKLLNKLNSLPPLPEPAIATE